jgi:hypothetical protein
MSDATHRFRDLTLGVTTYLGGGPSLMYAARAIAAYEEVSRPAMP